MILGSVLLLSVWRIKNLSKRKGKGALERIIQDNVVIRSLYDFLSLLFSIYIIQSNFLSLERIAPAFLWNISTSSAIVLPC